MLITTSDVVLPKMVAGTHSQEFSYPFYQISRRSILSITAPRKATPSLKQSLLARANFNM